jgi:hypothetical protein
MKIRTLAGAAIVLAATQVGAQEAEIRACAEVEADDERLGCYDALAAKVQPTESGGETKWRVRESASPIDDSPLVHMLLEAENTVTDLVAGDVRPKLWITCEEGQTSAYVDWGFTIGGGEKLFTVRLDRDEAEDAILKISNDFESIGSWQSDNVVRFLERMHDRNLLTVRTTSMSNDPLVAEFDIRGFDSVAAPLRAACNW